MTSTSKILCACALIILVTFSPAQKKKAVAAIFKPVGEVDYKTESKDWSKAKPATPLLSGDIVRTQENSFAIVKFLENSVLRVQEKSEVTISGEIAKREFSKNVYIERGGLGFDVKKRPNEKFEFSTPTSVASIRGTGGLLLAGRDSNDVLILGNGTVDYQNLLSHFTTKVTGGQTAYSFSNGTIRVEDSSPEDKRLLKENAPDSSKLEGSNLPKDSSATSSSGITIGLTMNAPISREHQEMPITVELIQSSIPLDSLKKIATDFTLFYQAKGDQGFKSVKAKLNDRATKFTVPAADVSAPSIQGYAELKLSDGSKFTSPTHSAESNPNVFPIQAAQKNELKIEFTDPSGKKKILTIEYK
ncbi:MAG: FecR family protein [Bacteroidota bacterium]|nr:FecR family protein [Bacteroidota bacterium]